MGTHRKPDRIDRNHGKAAGIVVSSPCVLTTRIPRTVNEGIQVLLLAQVENVDHDLRLDQLAN